MKMRQLIDLTEAAQAPKKTARQIKEERLAVIETMETYLVEGFGAKSGIIKMLLASAAKAGVLDELGDAIDHMIHTHLPSTPDVEDTSEFDHPSTLRDLARTPFHDPLHNADPRF